MKAGYEESQPFFEEAFDLYEPYAESGTAANTRYNQLLGLGTDEERAAGQQTYLSDPIFSSVLNQQSNALLRQQNARGGTYGGASTMAAGRLGLENYGNYLNRLQGQAGTGLAATGAQSAIRQGQGDLRYNFGATRAGNEINYGNAKAQASTVGVNNLLNLAGTAAKAYTAFSDVRLKRNIERVGEMPSGLPVYEFEYAWGPERHRGVMAQEALGYEQHRHAVGMDDSGFLVVDYASL